MFPVRVDLLLVAISCCSARQSRRKMAATSNRSTTVLVTQPTKVNETQQLFIYEVTDWMEIDNAALEVVVLVWLAALLALCLLGTLLLCAIRNRYRNLTEEKLAHIRVECERIRNVQGTGFGHKAPQLLTPAVTDQIVYYPLGELLKGDAIGGVL